MFTGATSFNLTSNDDLCNAFWENSTNFGIVSNITGRSETQSLHENPLVLMQKYSFLV